jgi:1-deoxy-D-xylulose-5-phosphate reductoisomerase
MTTAVTILGSTGTIGVNTLDVIARHPERFSVFALSANTNVDGLFAQCQAWNPPYAVMVDEPSASRLADRCRALVSPPRCSPATPRWRPCRPTSRSIT